MLKNKKQNRLLVAILMIFVVLFSISLYVYSLHNKQVIEESLSNSHMNLDGKSSESIEYLDSKNSFQFKYPSSWIFTNNREGKGLVPAKYCTTNPCNIEILTIGYRPEGNKNYDLKTLHEAHFGLGYTEQSDWETEKGYKVFYSVYNRSTFSDLTYTIGSKGDAYIQVNFRVKDNSAGGNFDYSQYIEDVNKIVESINFM